VAAAVYRVWVGYLCTAPVARRRWDVGADPVGLCIPGARRRPSGAPQRTSPGLAPPGAAWRWC